MIGISQSVSKSIKKAKNIIKRFIHFIFSDRDKNWNASDDEWDA